MSTSTGKVEIDGEKLDGEEELFLRLRREEMFQLMLMAHERDITLNKLIAEVLEDAISKAEKAGPV